MLLRESPSVQIELVGAAREPADVEAAVRVREGVRRGAGGGLSVAHHDRPAHLRRAARAAQGRVDVGDGLAVRIHDDPRDSLPPRQLDADARHRSLGLEADDLLRAGRKARSGDLEVVVVLGIDAAQAERAAGGRDRTRPGSLAPHADDHHAARTLDLEARLGPRDRLSRFIHDDSFDRRGGLERDRWTLRGLRGNHDVRRLRT